MLLDLRKGWATYDEAWRKETNPRHKKILGVLKEHIKWEVLGQPDKVLATVCADPIYRFYGLAEETTLRGRDEIRAFYQGLADTGANVLQLDIEHLAVADWGLSAHGIWHQVYPGSALIGPGGLVQDDSVDDPAASYLVSQRMSWFFPFTDDPEPLLVSEIVYFEQKPCAVRKLAPGENVFPTLDESVFS